MNRALMVVALLLLGAAIPPRAEARLTIHAPDDYAAQAIMQRWSDEAAQRVPMPAMSVRVRLRRCSKPDSAGFACAHVGRWGQIIDFPRELVELIHADAQWSDLALRTRLLFLHELGHVVDLRPARKRAWRQAFLGLFGLRPALQGAPEIGFRGLSPWVLAYDRQTRPVRPMEHFADAFAACVVWPDTPPDVAVLGAGYGYAPTAAQHVRACRIVHTMRPR